MAKRQTKKTSKATAKKTTTKTKLDSLTQVNGKDEQIQRAKELEELVGIKSINPYGTTIASEFDKKLDEMSMVDLQELAVKVGVFPSGTRSALKSKLQKGFRDYNRSSMVIPSPQQIGVRDIDDPKTQEALRLMREGL